MGKVVSMQAFQVQKAAVATEGLAEKIQVGKPFLLPAPEEGVRLDLFDCVPSVVISVPNLRGDELAAFRDGCEDFRIFVSQNTFAPVMMLSFVFPPPINMVEVNFDQRIANPVELAKVDKRKVLPEMDFMFYLVSEGICRGMQRLSVNAYFWIAFTAGIKYQEQFEYSRYDYTASLQSLYSYSPEEIMQKGQVGEGVWR